MTAHRFLFLIIFLLGFSSISFAQEVEVERELPPFTHIKATNYINVFLTKGEEPVIRIVTDGIDLEEVKIEVKDETLFLSLDKGKLTGGKVNVFLTYTHLYSIEATSFAGLSFQDIITCDSLSISTVSNGTIQAAVAAKTIDISAKTGGIVRLSGEANSYQAKLSSMANLSLLDLMAHSAHITATGKSIAKVWVTDNLWAQLRLGASLTIKGNPKVQDVQTGIGTEVLHQ